MRIPASKFQTIGAMGLLLLGAGTQLAFAQTSVPQQLNDLRKQVSQTGQSSPAPTQSKPPAPAAQPVVKPQANPPVPATKSSAQTQAKPSTPPVPQGQAKSPVPALPATQVAVKPQAGKPPAASTAKVVVVKPGAPIPVKAVNVKPGTTELGPRAQPPATVTKTAVVPAVPVVTPAVAVVPPVPERPNVARRDPFDPLVGKVKDAPSGGGPQAPLPAGKPGLVVATLRIDGVVKGTNGMIAIVSNPQMRVYFLREGDHLYDGNVEHISMEGVAFHETGKDAFGKSVEREVTKRLYPTPGEQQ